MAIRLDARAADFAEKFRGFLNTKRETAADVEAAVRAIVADVAARGDQALKDYTQKFDHVDLERIGLKVTSADIATATEQGFYVEADVRDVLSRIMNRGPARCRSC